ncbi:MAG: hypothetical protein KAR20_02625, partial [Candidatus Heimdallarchaeota archaeon]|nr:hypothetical protein [Candidatus Heimdallarchaeota archaeon]
NPLFSQLAVSTTVRQRMLGIKESILGWNSMIELVKRLKLDKDVKTRLDFEELISNLRKNIIIKLRGSNIISLTYFGEDPETTMNIVKTITEIFIDKNVEIQNQETSDAIIFIREQLHVYKGKIKSAEIAGLKDQLDELLVDSTEKHPSVKRYREQIELKKSALEKENLEYTEDIDLGPQSTNPIIDEIKRALNNIDSIGANDDSEDEGDLYKAMLMANLADVSARDVKVNEHIYNMLLQRLETAQITQRLQSSKEGTRYTILDPPRIPLKATKPNKILVALIGLFLGSVLGVALIIVAEFLDKSFIDVEEAKECLGMPLLGAISKINTVETVKKEKDSIRWLYFVTFLLGVAVIVAAVSFAKYAG